MMPAAEHPTPPTRRFENLLPIGAPTLEFSTFSRPTMNLTFLPRPPQCGSKKRSRAVADIDGEYSCVQKKKRRLRLFLITSRLSPQFSHPATNIVDRGSSKIAVWAKQKALGRNLLRKAAILNRVRRGLILTKEAQNGHGRVPVEQEREQAQLELARLEFNHGSVDTYTRPVLSQDPSVLPAAAVRTGGHFVVSGSPTNSPPSSRSPSPTSSSSSSPKTRDSPDDTAVFRSPNEAWSQSARDTTPRRDYLPMPPSPLGVSNYDAFDIDGNSFDPYAHLDDEDEPIPNPYDDDEDVPFSPSAVTNSSSTTSHTGTTNTTMFSDLKGLDYSEAVFGDYDQVEDGADALWPSTSTHDSPILTDTSTSPDVSALFATCLVAPKRTDSFAMSPNFRPRMPVKSVSPEMLAVTTTTASSPNFTTTPPIMSASPNFMPTTPPMSPNFLPVSTSPNFASSTATALKSPDLSSLVAPVSPNLVPIPKSPNFTALDTFTTPQNPLACKPTNTHLSEAGGPVHTSEVEEEHRRQRNLMFMRFGS